MLAKSSRDGAAVSNLSHEHSEPRSDENLIPNAQQSAGEVMPAAVGALSQTVGTKLGPVPSEARRTGVPPMTKALSAALSARSDGFDDIDGSPECRVYTQMRGVEQVRIGRGF